MDNNLPRGLRNCNPGNIRITNDKWLGLREEQTDKEFFQFKEMKWGYRALIRTLQNYRWKYDLQTIAEMIGRWAPRTENNTGGYISRVCKEMQVPSTYVPDIEDKGMMCALAGAISEVENGVPAVMSEIEEGWALL